MILPFVLKIFPLVSRELGEWKRRTDRIPEPELRTQALASIRNKRFHVQGGSVYALNRQVPPGKTVRFIVALQTISDYLDNLCDRAGVTDESAFFQLHTAMMDAVDPERPISDYYRHYPYQNDGGYLASLVSCCREQIRGLPSYRLVLPVIQKYVKIYSELQSYKHLDIRIREKRLTDWAQLYLESVDNIYWWEFAAATGSTLGMFLLFTAAGDPTLNQTAVEQIDRAYFPWVSGLHILLDYYIDAVEDREMGDFNFTFKYRNLMDCCDRLQFFRKKAEMACQRLARPEFHLTVIRGLLAMYLSDPKALTPEKRKYSLMLVHQAGMKCRVYHKCCMGLRRAGII